VAQELIEKKELNEKQVIELLKDVNINHDSLLKELNKKYYKKFITVGNLLKMN
jgi:hypothetical protein